jgi:hypothetical protein
VIRTSQGRKVEIIEPLKRHGELFSIRVAVDNQPCPGIRGPYQMWEQELKTQSEPEFWQNVADAALSMKDAEAMLR